jgi:hypothetical protein
MNNRLNNRERLHLARVKELPCSVCDEPGPSEAHHIEQKLAYTCIALCPSCHRDNFMGLHGQRRMWAIQKMSEMDALNVTIERLMK